MQTIGADQGLSQGMIYQILQDRTGFLWIATKDGLNRYDGYTFKIYKNDPFNKFSIGDNVVEALYEDRLGRIWVGTESNGVDVFDPVSGKFYHLSKSANGLPNQNVNAMAETSDGAMWVGTEHGLCRVVLPDVLPTDHADLSRVGQVKSFFWEFEQAKSQPPADLIKSLLSTADGNLWIGTAREAYRFDLKTAQKTVLPIAEPAYPGFSQKANFFSLAPDGSVWVSQYRRIIQCSGSEFKTIDLPYNNARFAAMVTFDLEGNMYIAFHKDIFMLSRENLAAPPIAGKGYPVKTIYTFPEADIIGATKILCDRSGLIWVGTNGYGIRKYNPNNRFFQHFLPGVSARRIVVDPQDAFVVWRIPSIFSPLDKTLPQPRYIDDNLFQHNCLYDHSGNLWLLVEYKEQSDKNAVLICINPKTGKETRFVSPISAFLYGQMIEDRQGHIWISGSKGDLAMFNPANQQFQSFDLSEKTGYKEFVYILYEDNQGSIWAGTPHGLLCAKRQQSGTFELKLFQNNPLDRNSLNNNSILSLLDDPDKPDQLLWVGTRGGGLNLLEKSTGHCQHFTGENGLPNDVVYAIQSDGSGHLWMSTNAGLSKLNRQNSFFQNFSAADGLQDNEFNSGSFAKNKKGTLAFGGVNGFTLFDPGKINPIKGAIPIQITALKIQNTEAVPGNGLLKKNIEYTQTVTLTHDQNYFTIEFAALDFSAPHKNQFRHRLLGATNKWSEPTTEHSTNFSNLPAGTYTFEVMTGGAHGTWTGEPARLNIIVLAPWWKTNTAYLLYLVILAFLSWKIYQEQLRRIKLQEQLAFEHREAERVKALEQIKTNFFNNITHELRTPVTLILEPLRQILRYPNAENWQAKVQLAENNSQKLLSLVNELLDLAKIDAAALQPVYKRGLIAPLLQGLADLFEESAKEKGIQLHREALGAPIPAFDFDQVKIEKIITNLLSNALKFTPKAGQITMRWWATEQQWFVLEINDSGPGIAATDLPRIFERFYSANPGNDTTQHSTGIGLALCQELAGLMDGHIEAESQPDCGATFRLHLPMIHLSTNTLREAAFAHEQPESVDKVTLAPSAQAAKDSARPLLLLAEDSLELRKFIGETLSEKFEVLEAADGQAAVELAIEHIPDIVVSDVMMPRLDGIGLLDALKSDVRTSHIPVLMLTAKSSLTHRIEGLQHGADAYLGKPFQTEELIAWIENLLAGRKLLQARFSHHPAQHLSSPASEQPDLGQLDRAFLEKLNHILEAEIDNDKISAEELARQMAMSRSQLHRKISAMTGVSVMEYLRNYRLDRAHELLGAGVGNVSEVAWQVGFVNPKHFSTSFKERFGKSPSDLRK